MSIRSTALGAVHLRGKDAEKFRNQLAHGRPKKAAVEALARGRASAAQYVKDGYAPLKPSTRL
jgi:hypothetical protein